MNANVDSVSQKFKKTDIGVIPEEWSLRSLAEIGRCLIGLTYDPKDIDLRGVLVLRSSNIGESSLQFGDDVYVKMRIPDQLIVRENDLLICVRNGSRPLIGKCALLGREAVGMTFGAFMSVFRADDSRFVYHCFQSDIIRRQIRRHLGATINQITNKSLKSFTIPYPDRQERRTITQTLSDVDSLVNALNALIAKKKAVKKAAMQQLLSGNSRLPGFSLPWHTRQLGEIAKIQTGSRNNQDKVQEGQYPFFVRSATIERINSFSYEGEAILVPGEGGIENIFHYINGRFEVHQRVYMISQFSKDVCGKLVFYNMVLDFGSHAMQYTVKATVDSLRLPTFKQFSFSLPKDIVEQRAIATVLSNMDDEIVALEERRDKIRAVRKGMMQQLLSGRVRLVETEY